MADSASPNASPFGPVHVVEPQAPHTHTAVFFHGRGSSGDEFAEELLDETKLSTGQSLVERFPGWRWVFPSSRMLWSTAFEEDMPAWFEAHSLTDTTARQDLQQPGLREAVAHLGTIVDDEVARLGGHPEKVVLGGISQGAAVGQWTLLDQARAGRRVGAFVGASTWLPFAAEIGRVLGGRTEDRTEDSVVDDSPDHGHPVLDRRTADDAFVEAVLGPARAALSASVPSAFLSTPVFLGHGRDDAYVDVTLGEQARRVLERIGLAVEWKEYTGAEQEGHWIKAPEEVDDIAAFLSAHVGGA